MMNFKSNSGFTLIEVLLALALVGLTIMPIFNLQSLVFSAVERSSRYVEAAFEAKQVLMRSLFDLDDISKKQPEEEETFFTTKYEQANIADTSALQNVEHIMKKYVTVSWSNSRGMQQKQLVCFWQAQKEVKK